MFTFKSSAPALTIPQRIYDFLTERRAEAWCDQCLQKALSLTCNAHVQQNTQAFGVTSDFERKPGFCGQCGKEKQRVIRRI